ncbi:hypothetical protein F5B18DRAFT_218734 [Nemania serpens]|nr:hypothetical protein F5B18DRAFT_218734 [Nemania serpens]
MTGGSDSVTPWQIDIPNLAKLVLNAGARGLKELDLAGIDMHSLGCLLFIGELAPLSVNFRKRLDICRRKQRESSRLIYRAIEIGAGTNFLVDHLLKTRAGENVLGLFASMIPILSESEYVSVCLLCYESVLVETESTPGIGQLQKLRSALQPFAAAVDINSKILQYHALFARYNADGSDPSSAIPNPHSMVKIIQTMRKLLSEDQMILRYHGIRGAAWATAFATDLLGLRACMIVPSADGPCAMPLTSDLSNAQVILYVAESDGTVELCKLDNVEDFLDITSISETGIEWIINCDTVNFFTTNNPRVESESLLRLASEYAAAKALDMATMIAHELSFSVNVPQEKNHLPSGLQTFQSHLLPAVHTRCLQILDILGFSPPEYHMFAIDGTGHTKGIDRGSPPSHELSNLSPTYWELPRSSHGDSLWPREVVDSFQCLVTDWVARNKDSGFPTAAVKPLLETIKNAVLFASHMAFTDWHKSLRRISVAFFRQTAVLNGGDGGNINKDNRMRRIQQFVTAHPAPGPLFWSLGQEINGLVLPRQVPLNPHLHELDGIIISYQPGHILYEGERCTEILNSANPTLPHSGGVSYGSPQYRPYSLDIGIQLQSYCKLGSGCVYVSFETQQSSGARRISLPETTTVPILSITPEVICEVLSSLLVTRKCSHDYFDPLPPSTREKYDWVEGLSLWTSYFNPRAGNDGDFLSGTDSRRTSTDQGI